MRELAFSSNLGANYELEERIGEGASGVVWRAHDKRTNDVVVAKILREEHTQDLDLVTRFIQERSLLLKLKGPQIVGVKDLVVEGSRIAIVMEYVDGVSLREVLKIGNLRPVEAATITLHVLEGLKIAHENNVVHRDVKPDNVLLTKGWQKGKQGTIKLTDFGISRLITEGRSTSTSLVGTPEYLPPELIERGEASYPADVYGVGIMLYELIAGRTPFAGKGTDFSILHRHTTAEVPPLAVRQELWDLLLQMLEKRPHMRIGIDSAIETLKSLLPLIEDDSALEPQEAPEEFIIAYGPMTVLRGADIGVKEKKSSPVQPSELPEVAVPDLGEADNRTVLRPRDITARKPVRGEGTEPSDSGKRPPKKIVIFSFLGALFVALLFIGGYFLFSGSQEEIVADPVHATITEKALPSGLSIEREATYAPAEHKLELKITYLSGRTPLSGPFFEIVELDGACADITWNIPEQTRNVSAQTYIDARCGWSLDPGLVDGSVSITGTINAVERSFSEEALEKWLNGNIEATAAAISDPDVQSSAYAVQRLQGFSVEVGSRTLSGEPIKVSLLPVWASGIDELHPIYVSPHTGQVTQVFSAVAQDESRLRFVDGCAGAVSVSRDGLKMTALRPANQCEIHVQLGDFDEVVSNRFEIVGHDS